ncbi:HTH domain-containing protein [Chitinophaga sedimenti]|uniref:HTH domain-containing protein n=1 Tax=Chitinophaga sedimenti TaxID=2033606 RepID=UPI0020040070|nr:HTH domain-containing protein [Chitinophaga sedimenti]MCK7557591.1 HTH domain-containing protein [Chitinophaga sedimenti]
MASGKADELFLGHLNDIILQNLDNAQLDGEFLAESLNMSRPTLYRKIKTISNLTVHELINLARLKKQQRYLQKENSGYSRCRTLPALAHPIILTGFFRSSLTCHQRVL